MDLIKEGNHVVVAHLGAQKHGIVRYVGNEMEEEGDRIVRSAIVELDGEVPTAWRRANEATNYGGRPVMNGVLVPVQALRHHSSNGSTVPTSYPISQPTTTKRTEEFGTKDSGVEKQKCGPAKDSLQLVGRQKGIQGYCNSCYLDATLYAMFAQSTVFDFLLEKSMKTSEKEALFQKILAHEIVFPLRKFHYVRADHVMKLRRLLGELMPNMTGLTNEEKDPEEILPYIFAQIFHVDPFIKLMGPNQSKDSQFLVPIVVNDWQSGAATSQHLLERHMEYAEVKFAKPPPVLIMQLPRYGQQKVFDKILPLETIDITPFVNGAVAPCTRCGACSELFCPKCFLTRRVFYTETVFCWNCFKHAHCLPEYQDHEARPLYPPGKPVKKPHSHKMSLSAVLCIETSHYVAYVRTASNQWVFFDSMADREGPSDEYNVPVVRECGNMSDWLSLQGWNRLKDADETGQIKAMFGKDAVDPLVGRLLSDSYICFYEDISPAASSSSSSGVKNLKERQKANGNETRPSLIDLNDDEDLPLSSPAESQLAPKAPKDPRARKPTPRKTAPIGKAPKVVGTEGLLNSTDNSEKRDSARHDWDPLDFAPTPPHIRDRRLKKWAEMLASRRAVNNQAPAAPVVPAAPDSDTSTQNFPKRQETPPARQAQLNGASSPEPDYSTSTRSSQGTPVLQDRSAHLIGAPSPEADFSTSTRSSQGTPVLQDRSAHLIGAPSPEADYSNSTRSSVVTPEVQVSQAQLSSPEADYSNSTRSSASPALSPALDVHAAAVLPVVPESGVFKTPIRLSNRRGVVIPPSQNRRTEPIIASSPDPDYSTSSRSSPETPRVQQLPFNGPPAAPSTTVTRLSTESTVRSSDITNVITGDASPFLGPLTDQVASEDSFKRPAPPLPSSSSVATAVTWKFSLAQVNDPPRPSTRSRMAVVTQEVEDGIQMETDPVRQADLMRRYQARFFPVLENPSRKRPRPSVPPLVPVEEVDEDPDVDENPDVDAVYEYQRSPSRDVVYQPPQHSDSQISLRPLWRAEDQRSPGPSLVIGHSDEGAGQSDQAAEHNDQGSGQADEGATQNEQGVDSTSKGKPARSGQMTIVPEVDMKYPCVSVYCTTLYNLELIDKPFTNVVVRTPQGIVERTAATTVNGIHYAQLNPDEVGTYTLGIVENGEIFKKPLLSSHSFDISKVQVFDFNWRDKSGEIEVTIRCPQSVRITIEVFGPSPVTWKAPYESSDRLTAKWKTTSSGRYFLKIRGNNCVVFAKEFVRNGSDNARRLVEPTITLTSSGSDGTISLYDSYGIRIPTESQESVLPDHQQVCGCAKSGLSLMKITDKKFKVLHGKKYLFPTFGDYMKTPSTSSSTRLMSAQDVSSDTFFLIIVAFPLPMDGTVTEKRNEVLKVLKHYDIPKEAVGFVRWSLLFECRFEVCIELIGKWATDWTDAVRRGMFFQRCFNLNRKRHGTKITDYLNFSTKQNLDSSLLLAHLIHYTENLKGSFFVLDGFAVDRNGDEAIDGSDFQDRHPETMKSLELMSRRVQKKIRKIMAKETGGAGALATSSSTTSNRTDTDF